MIMFNKVGFTANDDKENDNNTLTYYIKNVMRLLLKLKVIGTI
jgi:predicted lactoylglutathione lyase